VQIDFLKLMRLPAVQEAIRRENGAFEENITRKRFALLDDLEKAETMLDSAEVETEAARKLFESAQAAMFVERGKLGNAQRRADVVKQRISFIRKQLHDLGEGHAIYGESRAASIKAHLEREIEKLKTSAPAQKAEQKERREMYRAKLMADLETASSVVKRMAELRYSRVSPIELTESVDRLLEEIGINAEENSTFLTT